MACGDPPPFRATTLAPWLDIELQKVSNMRCVFLFCLAALAASACASPDLGVTCISRAPLYWRYNVVYPNGLPILAPTHDNQDPSLDQHWPNPGEGVSFTAHIRNHGDVAVSGFSYRWWIDGTAFGTLKSYAGTVQPGAETAVSMKWPWPADLSDHTVKIIVDPNNVLGDTVRRNNSYTDYTNALSFSIWVEQGLYERFNKALNGFGTHSFADWFRWQFDMMRRNFARSIYPDVAPNGILERLRVEEINVIPFDPNDLNNWRTVMANDPHLMLNDGRWQFTSDRGTLTEKQQDWDNYVATFATQIDWGLIHELSHQLGVIDEYRLNTWDPVSSSNLVTWANGTPIQNVHLFHQGGLMGGGYVLPGYDGNTYDSHTAGYLNLNLHYRRGYYGEYLFDTPANTYVKVLDIAGNPLPGATLAFFQKNANDEILYNTPTFKVLTDANGVAKLPNRATPTVTTATGHTLRANPFGTISVVGQNGTMLARITKARQQDVRWFEVDQINVAYWQAQTQDATLTFRTKILPGLVHVGALNLALDRPTTASSSPATTGNANDGDVSDPTRTWAPNPTAKGQWWQVDLGADHPICRAVVYPFCGNPHDWYGKFHFEVSKTGAFAGEQKIVAAEKNFDVSCRYGDASLQALTGLLNRVVYTFPAATGRYFRIVSDVDQSWVQLQELQLYEKKAD